MNKHAIAKELVRIAKELMASKNKYIKGRPEISDAELKGLISNARKKTKLFAFIDPRIKRITQINEKKFDENWYEFTSYVMNKPLLPMIDKVQKALDSGGVLVRKATDGEVLGMIVFK